MGATFELCFNGRTVQYSPVNRLIRLERGDHGREYTLWKWFDARASFFCGTHVGEGDRRLRKLTSHSKMLLQLLLCLSRADAVVLDVERYGAKADNATVNTVAFRGAFADARALISNSSSTTRVTVRAAAQGVYVTGCFNITSMITFAVALGATVMGVQDDSNEQYVISDSFSFFLLTASLCILVCTG